MSKLAIYTAETGKVVTTVPDNHLFAEYVIRRLEAGKHSAELVYDDLWCIHCGSEESLALNRHADGNLYFVCESCHN